MTNETENQTEYVSEPKRQGFKAFIAKRWVRVTGISVASALALAGAFGVGVAAGHGFGPHDGRPDFAKGNHQPFEADGGRQFGHGPDGDRDGGRFGDREGLGDGKPFAPQGNTGQQPAQP